MHRHVVTFDLAVVILTFKILSRLYLRNRNQLILGSDIDWGIVGLQGQCVTLI